MAVGVHPVPSRTRSLSPPAPMVLGEQSPGRVGRRQPPPACVGPFLFLSKSTKSTDNYRPGAASPAGFDSPGLPLRSLFRCPSERADSPSRLHILSPKEF